MISRKTKSSNQSVHTSKTYISELENKLAQEKRAREKLEREMQELRRISSAISQ